MYSQIQYLNFNKIIKYIEFSVSYSLNGFFTLICTDTCNFKPECKFYFSSFEARDNVWITYNCIDVNKINKFFPPPTGQHYMILDLIYFINAPLKTRKSKNLLQIHELQTTKVEHKDTVTFNIILSTQRLGGGGPKRTIELI